MGDLSAAQSTINTAVVAGTNSKQALAWKRYSGYLNSIEIHNDDYLEQFNHLQKQRILGAFANAIRTNRFHRTKLDNNKSEFCTSSTKCIAQAYRMAGRPDPNISREDPRISNHLQNHTSHNNSGSIPKDAFRPIVSLFY